MRQTHIDCVSQSTEKTYPIVFLLGGTAVVTGERNGSPEGVSNKFLFDSNLIYSCDTSLFVDLLLFAGWQYLGFRVFPTRVESEFGRAKHPLLLVELSCQLICVWHPSGSKPLPQGFVGPAKIFVENVIPLKAIHEFSFSK